VTRPYRYRCGCAGFFFVAGGHSRKSRTNVG
jgi:hypothetical protein